jgi:hypothetical protein
MDNAATLVQPHAAAILDSLLAALRSSDSRAKLAAAKQILRWAWGPAGTKRETAETVPPGGLSQDQERRAVELLRQLLPIRKGPNPAATSCPARHAAAPAGDAPEVAPSAPTEDAGAARAATPCQAADAAPAASPIPPDPVINPMSRESGPSPLAAPPGTEAPRRDADPMSRALLPARHSDDPFHRPLPQPPPIEPPRPFVSDAEWQARQRRRW